MHRGFPSNHKMSASSRTIQFHWICIGDSGEVVTPFMHVGTYPTKNFATFGPSELQPPFTEVSIQCLHISSSLYSTGQTSDPIHHLTISQSPVFLLNSRHPLLFAILIYFFYKKPNILKPPLSRSYRVNLPSSFNTILPSALV